MALAMNRPCQYAPVARDSIAARDSYSVLLNSYRLMLHAYMIGVYIVTVESNQARDDG